MESALEQTEKKTTRDGELDGTGGKRKILHEKHTRTLFGTNRVTSQQRRFKNFKQALTLNLTKKLIVNTGTTLSLNLAVLAQ